MFNYGIKFIIKYEKVCFESTKIHSKIISETNFFYISVFVSSINILLSSLLSQNINQTLFKINERFIMQNYIVDPLAKHRDSLFAVFFKVPIPFIFKILPFLN